MGSPESEVGREKANNDIGTETQVNVRFSRDYYVSVFELTQAQYRHITRLSPSTYTGEDADMHPVKTVSYNNLRGNGTGPSGENVNWPTNSNPHEVASGSSLFALRAAMGNAYEFDLPTCAEWEYACRAGTVTAFNNEKNLENINVYRSANLEGVAWYNNDANGNTIFRRLITNRGRRGFLPDDCDIERWQVNFLVEGGMKTPPGDPESAYTRIPYNSVAITTHLSNKGDAAERTDIEISISRKELKPRGRKYRPDLDWEGSELSDEELDAALTVRKQVRMWFKKDKTGPCVNWIVFTPRHAKKPSPVILFLNYRGNHELVPDKDVYVQKAWTQFVEKSDNYRASARTRGTMTDPDKDTIFPLGMLIARGYAVMSACYCEVSPDPDWTEKNPAYRQDPFAYTGVTFYLTRSSRTKATPRPSSATETVC